MSLHCRVIFFQPPYLNLQRVVCHPHVIPATLTCLLLSQLLRHVLNVQDTELASCQAKGRKKDITVFIIDFAKVRKQLSNVFDFKLLHVLQHHVIFLLVYVSHLYITWQFILLNTRGHAWPQQLAA